MLVREIIPAGIPAARPRRRVKRLLHVDWKEDGVVEVDDRCPHIPLDRQSGSAEIVLGIHRARARLRELQVAVQPEGATSPFDTSAFTVLMLGMTALLLAGAIWPLVTARSAFRDGP